MFCMFFDSLRKAFQDPIRSLLGSFGCPGCYWCGHDADRLEGLDGVRIMVVGRPGINKWTDKEGNDRTDPQTTISSIETIEDVPPQRQDSGPPPQRDDVDDGIPF